MIHKPDIALHLQQYLTTSLGISTTYQYCCRRTPDLGDSTIIINTCPGCDRRYRELYDNISTVSLWELLAETQNFPFPDYGGIEMSIHDACPTRTEVRVHKAIRKLLERMNITVVEPALSGANTICCGDSCYGHLPVQQVKEQMKKRAHQMPCDDVVVYCVSCIKAMHIGGKRPRYIVDLLFAEDTPVGTWEPAEWHKELQEYIDEH